MIKVNKMISGKPVRIGNFKSYVAFADWLDKKPSENIGAYYIIPSNCTRGIASMDRIEYDGALCTSQRRGAI